MRILRRGDVFSATSPKGTVVFALLERAGKNGWDAMIIGGDHPAYPPGGHDIFVFDNDLEDCQTTKKIKEFLEGPPK